MVAQNRSLSDRTAAPLSLCLFRTSGRQLVNKREIGIDYAVCLTIAFYRHVLLFFTDLV